MRGWKWKGSFTVEASLLMPAILFCLLFVIAMAVYVHDRSVMESAACEICLKGEGMLPLGEHAAEERMERTARELLNGRLLFTKNLQADAEIGLMHITVQIRGETIGFGGKVIRAEGKIRRADGVTFIRNYRKFMGKEDEG